MMVLSLLLGLLINVYFVSRGTFVIAVGPSQKLSVTAQSKNYRESENLSLIRHLVTIVSTHGGDARLQALVKLHSLTLPGEIKQNRVDMASNDLGLLSVLAAIVQSDRGEARDYALKTILLSSRSRDTTTYAWALLTLLLLSVEDANRAYMGSKELDLLPSLVNIVKSNHGNNLTVIALGTIASLSHDDKNKIYMGSKDLGLLSVLITVVSSTIGEPSCRLTALKALQKLSTVPENSRYMVSKDLDLPLLPTLVRIVSSEAGDARLDALRVLGILASYTDNRHSMSSKHLGLLPALIAVVLTDSGAARLVALQTLQYLTFESSEDNIELISKDLALIPFLVGIVSSETGDTLVDALQLLRNAITSENARFMGSEDLGLLHSLVKLVLSDSGDARIAALQNIFKLSMYAENKVHMISKNGDLLPALIAVVSFDSGNARLLAVGTLQSLTLDKQNRIYMGTKYVGLIPALVEVVVSGSDNARLSALQTLQKFSFEPECRDNMGLRDDGLLSALLGTVSSDNSNDARSTALIILCNLSLQLRNIEHLVSLNFSAVIFPVLLSSPKDSMIFRCSLLLLMSTSRDLSAALALAEVAGTNLVSTLLDCYEAGNIDAAIMLCFLLGKDESAVAQLSLLDSKTKVEDVLDSVFNTTMHGLDVVGYQFGYFDLQVIVTAIASMAVSDANKAILLEKPTILRNLFQVLSLFLEEAPPIPYRGTIEGLANVIVGGGGDDIESAESAIKALHQLSFFYDSDDKLREQYMSAAADDAVSILQRLASHSKLGNDAKRGANYLISRLGRPSTSASSVTTVASTDKKHVLISYAPGCRKELVGSLQESLIALGFDVWKDDTGSSLLQEMRRDSNNDIMAQAIEMSHTVVVCVSPHYHASAICRQEAQHIHALCLKRKLNVIYVMMDRSYSYAVDGWLKDMMQDSPRHPLWDTQYVSKTAMCVAKHALPASHRGTLAVSTPLDNHFLRPRTGFQPLSTLDSAPPFQSSQIEVYEELWALISDPSKACDSEESKATLSKLGLSKPSELVDCD
eukprot:gene24097-31308_t